jgi:hypothetical protein
MSYDQLFCKPVDTWILRNFFEKISQEKNGSYLIDYNAYKKMLFHNLQTTFFEQLRPYYQKSKHFYLDRELTYKAFATILRQVCKYNSIKITSRVRYIESIYTNEYTIFMDNTR